MPDWLTHVGLAWIFGRPLRTNEYRVAFLFGSVLPDVEKLYILLSAIVGLNTAKLFFFPTHTIVGALLLSAVFSILFRLKDFRDFWRVVGFLFLGSLLHLFLDLFIIPQGPLGGMYLFWPLSWQELSFNLIVIGDFRPSLVTSLICLFLIIRDRSRFDLKKNMDRLFKKLPRIFLILCGYSVILHSLISVSHLPHEEEEKD